MCIKIIDLQLFMKENRKAANLQAATSWMVCTQVSRIKKKDHKPHMPGSHGNMEDEFGKNCSEDLAVCRLELVSPNLDTSAQSYKMNFWSNSTIHV